MKIELSKDEIENIYWAVSCLIADFERDPFNFLDASEKDLEDLKLIENKFGMLCDKVDKENEN